MACLNHIYTCQSYAELNAWLNHKNTLGFSRNIVSDVSPNLFDKNPNIVVVLLKPLLPTLDETSRGENWMQGSFIHCNKGMLSFVVTLFVGSPHHEFIGTLTKDVSTRC